MRNILKVGSVAVFVLAAGFVFATNGTQPVSAERNEAAASPRSLYLQHCAACHGANGKAQTALGKKFEADDLTASNASVSKIIRYITNGRGDMPSFKKKMTAAQISSLAAYVHGM